MGEDLSANDEILAVRNISIRTANKDQSRKRGDITESDLQTHDLRSLGILLCGLSAVLVMGGVTLTFVLLV